MRIFFIQNFMYVHSFVFERQYTGREAGPDLGVGQPVMALRRHWNKRKYGAIIPGFHTLKNFSVNYPKSGHVPSKLFAVPVLG